MVNGNFSEFIDHIYYGDELIFLYRGQKFFLQGLKTDEKLTLYLDRWEPPADDYVWVGIGESQNYPVDEFLNANLWDNRNFYEAENEMEWTDW